MAMKKSVMAMGLGLPPEDMPAEDDDMVDLEGGEDPAATEADVAEDQAIDAFLDPEADPETKREAFKRAVQLCVKRGAY